MHTSNKPIKYKVYKYLVNITKTYIFYNSNNIYKNIINKNVMYICLVDTVNTGLLTIIY